MKTTSTPTAGSSGNGLRRTLGVFPLTNIVVANMIGAGIFTTSGLLMRDLRDPGLMLLLWAVGGVIALCGALSYGELGAALPHAGGEYAFLSRIFHPLPGFLSGWVSFFVGFSAPIAASAIGFTEYLVRAVPGLLPDGDISNAGKKALAIAVILAFTLLHTRGLELGIRVQNILTILKVALVVGLIVGGFSLGRGSLTHFAPGPGPGTGFAAWKTAGLSLMWILFAYSGWNASAYLGSEVKNPARNLPRSLLLGTGLVTILYIALNLFYIYATPPGEMEGVISIAALAAGSLFGAAVESVIAVFVSFALFSSLSAFIILGPRVYYAMARDGHFFKSLAVVHPRFGVPARAILLQGAIASIMVLLGTFDQLLTYMGFSLGLFPLLAVWGLFKLRRKGHRLLKFPLFPLAPIIYLAAGAAVLILSYFERPFESSLAVLTVLVGIPVYLLFRKARNAAPPDERRDAETAGDAA